MTNLVTRMRNLSRHPHSWFTTLSWSFCTIRIGVHLKLRFAKWGLTLNIPYILPPYKLVLVHWMFGLLCYCCSLPPSCSFFHLFLLMTTLPGFRQTNYDEDGCHDHDTGVTQDGAGGGQRAHQPRVELEQKEQHGESGEKRASLQQTNWSRLNLWKLFCSSTIRGPGRELLMVLAIIKCPTWLQ